jgi:hypothetical protein
LAQGSGTARVPSALEDDAREAREGFLEEPHANTVHAVSIRQRKRNDMDNDQLQNAQPANCRKSPWLTILIIGCVLIGFIAIILPRPGSRPDNGQVVANSRASGAGGDSAADRARHRERHAGLTAVSAPREAAEQIVARKAAQFARSRHEVAYAMARKREIAVPPEVERFFAAAQSGTWEQVQAAFEAFRSLRGTAERHDLDPFAGPVWATLCALEQVHLWPAQEYLDYGNAILNSLRPGMVYVGGTDPGRGIPELLNETNDGEKHVVLTQNALADPSYLDYLSFIYADQLVLPTHEEAEQAFKDYMADAKKRLMHDQQFPDELKQVKPDEHLSTDENGNISASGPVSIMGVNEFIFQQIMQKNPGLAFGLEESYPLKSTYADATTMGPIMELRTSDHLDALTADTASQSIAYWQQVTQQLQSDPAATDSPECIKAYSKLIASQANLFTSHGLNDQAEQAYRLSLQIWPSIPETIFNYVDLLTGENRSQEALAVAESGAKADPKNKDLQNLVSRLRNSGGARSM